MPTHSLWVAAPGSPDQRHCSHGPTKGQRAGRGRLVVGGTLGGLVCWSLPWGDGRHEAEAQCRPVDLGSLDMAQKQALRCTSLAVDSMTGRALASFSKASSSSAKPGVGVAGGSPSSLF